MTDSPLAWVMLLAFIIAAVAFAIAMGSMPGAVVGGISLGWTFRCFLGVLN